VTRGTVAASLQKNRTVRIDIICLDAVVVMLREGLALPLQAWRLPRPSDIQGAGSISHIKFDVCMNMPTNCVGLTHCIRVING
jgi:hypothetical protein